MRKVILGLTFVLVLVLALAALPACGDDGGAEFELSGLTISPSSAGMGQTVTISVTVKNVGDDEGDTEVTLKVAGSEVDSKSVTVAGGASKSVSFSHSEAAAGTYSITVDGLSGTLTVTAGPTVTYLTYTHPDVGYSYDYPDNWPLSTVEEIWVGTAWAPDTLAGTDIIQFLSGFASTTAEAGYNPNVMAMAYVLPVPFAPRAFYQMNNEPNPDYGGETTYQQIWPGFTEVWSEDVRTNNHDRVALLFSATWSSVGIDPPEDGEPFPWSDDFQVMGSFVSKAGNMYLVICTTTQASFAQYEAIFRDICMSVTVPE